MILIGYSGHAYVAYSIAKAMGKTFTGYCDMEEKKFNPFELEYHGSESNPAALKILSANDFFIAIGHNETREIIYQTLAQKNLYPGNVIHPSAVICSSSKIATHGVMISSNVVINPLSTIGAGVICNTSCVIEHECVIGDFSHIGPGAVICGNVKIGDQTFVGAASVILQGIRIGKNVVIGAGAVVVKDVADHTTVIGNPAR